MQTETVFNAYIVQQLLGVDENTLVYCLSDTRANFGIFIHAILKEKRKVHGGKTTYAYVEKITLGELLQVWAQAHGVNAQYVPMNKQVYGTLWPGLGSEFIMGMEFFDWIKDRASWAGDDGVLHWRDLGIDYNALTGIKQAVSALPI
ncbi:hypothetical protein GGR55DRAFT_678969 [Xylaria sp. FL0064]|nr:hypothetical protein GGR55DRAFT_678969 [Xylaria sp. FL0064]